MRSLNWGWRAPILIVAVVAGLFHFYTTGFGSPEPRVFRGLHLLLLLPPLFILFPATARSPKHRPSILDLLLSAVCLAGSGYMIHEAARLNWHFVGVHEVRPVEVLLGAAMALAVIEAARRSMSKWFAVTIGTVLFYLFTCEYWPGLFRFKAFTFSRAIEILFLPNDDGMFGFLTGISAEILYIYILFAAVMTATGAGDFLTDFANWAAGWARGGAAKMAVISSALYGTVSGSTVANVYATGSFTIPLMKRAGYTPKQAAAIESVAGVGGQIMPPIMGTGAFIMAEVTGIPYFSIIKMAALPALLYYLGVFAMVHFIARKKNIQSIAKADRPTLKSLLRRAYYILPFGVILGLLAVGYSPGKAAFHTTWVTFLLAFLDRATWLNFQKILDIFFKAMVNAALIAAILAGAGMTVGVLTRTGVALSFGQILASASGGYLLVALLLVFLVVSVLGTGIPTTPAYIISVTVGAQALGNFGVPLIAAHLFVFYYAVLADLTPPDAVTSFAAANIAGAGPMETGFEGCKFCVAGFLVPFAFVFQPAILLKGSWDEIILAAALTSGGVIWLAAGIIGFLSRPLGWLQRLLLVGAALLLAFPTRSLNLLGLGLGLAVWMWARLTRPRGGG